jgi:hypothetical protein
VSTNILGFVRPVVLTSIVVAAATAAAGTPADSQCQLGDGAPGAAISRACDQDLDRRPGIGTPVAAPVTPIALPPAPAVALGVAPVPPAQAPAARAVIAFAPKTSPPRARWF